MATKNLTIPASSVTALKAKAKEMGISETKLAATLLKTAVESNILPMSLPKNEATKTVRFYLNNADAEMVDKAARRSVKGKEAVSGWQSRVLYTYLQQIDIPI